MALNSRFKSIVGKLEWRWKSAIAALPRVEPRFPEISRRARRLFGFVLVLSSLAGLAAGFLSLLNADVSIRAWDPREVVTKAQYRLQAISASLDSTRDRFSRDAEILLALSSHNGARLFPLIADRDSVASQRIGDSLLYSNAGEDGLADHGEAIYDAQGHILAWYSSHPGVFGFDTLLTGAALLPRGERDNYLESDPLHAYVNSLRKVVNGSSTIGYVLVKRQVETKEPFSIEQPITFIDDIRDAAHRDVYIDFGPRAREEHSDSEWTRAALFASPEIPTSFVGTISVSDRPANDPSSVSRMLRTIWSLGWTLVLLSILLWFTYGMIRGVTSATRASGRFVVSAALLLALVFARLLLVQFGGLEEIAGQRVQDASGFGSPWGWGIVSDPLELFLTSFFAAGASALLWLVWAPRDRLLAVHDASRSHSRRRVMLRLLYAVIAIVSVTYLSDALSYVVESTVANSSYHFLTVKQVWPSRPLLMMLLSFLSIGVAYLFLSVLLLAFAARALSLLMTERVRPERRALFGCLVVLVALGLTTWIGNDADGQRLDANLRWSLSAIAFAITSTIVLIDALGAGRAEGSSSFLYRLPRSSRSLLFVLAISAALLSPLVADWQVRSDQQIAEHIAEANASVDTPELETTIGSALFAAQTIIEQNLDTSSTWSASELRQTAFLTWLGALRFQPSWNAIIDVIQRDGYSVSHFATAGAVSELSRLHSIRDTAMQIALHKKGHVITRSIPCFTGSCTPAVIGALQPDLADSTIGMITIAAWSELPSLTVQRSNFDLLRPVTANQAAEYGFVVAQYRPNMRRVTNQPSLDVPAAIPVDVELGLRKRRAFWHRSTIGGVEYRTLYYRSGATDGDPLNGTVITISVPEPTLGRKVEFGLRLNAIGLIFGTIVSLLLLGLRQLSQHQISFTLRFRDRIFLVVLLISLVPLVVVTNVTRSLLTQRAQMEAQDRLARDASVIKDRIGREMESGVSNIFGLDLQSEVMELSQIIGREFSIFDPNGFLHASTKPELYESSLLASTMSSRAMREVVLGRRSFYSEPLVLNRQRYQVGYQPVMASQGNKLLAVVSLSTVDEQAQMEEEVARTTSFIYGTFAALGFVLLAIGAVFAARVASPITSLIRATQRVAQGKLKTHIPVDRDDEIGELMHAFNAMTEELEKSREIVAQNERELAWKEMARQVAHEIKNPLTPMKLSVQHLEHAHEAKDPNFNSIFRRVIRTVGEQIDVLTRIATEFSRFGEMPRRKWGPTSLRRVADSAVALFDAERSRIRFIIDVPHELSDVHADEQELRRALVNLIRNAVQAIEGWGVIVIRATQEAGMIHVKLTDTGSGMDDATLARVFDPNFSTKTSGMGLGLAIVKKTITDMAGTIRVESKVGHGTTFFIDLPARGYVEEGDE